VRFLIVQASIIQSDHGGVQEQYSDPGGRATAPRPVTGARERRKTGLGRCGSYDPIIGVLAKVAVR
jgi:hypothetical protein